MRVKYPVDNLENRKWAITHNVFEISLSTLQKLGYMLKHGDFSDENVEPLFSDFEFCSPQKFCEMRYKNYEVMYCEEQRELILITVDFIINYLSIDSIRRLINDPSETYYLFASEFNTQYEQKIKNIIADYIEENKEEFPEAYLELMLGD